MDNKRQQKFARLIQKDLGEIFQKEARNQFEGAFISVTEVKVSPDLGIARVHVSFMLAKNKALLLEQIQDYGKNIRQMLANRIRHQVRVIPELHFYLDETADYAAKMDAIITNLNIPPAPPEEEEDNDQ
ncbi:MAG: 30S ribosome-binding factor RbfA [Bacteroidota bacterium]